MGLDIYNLVVDIIGELPVELEFIYAIGVLFVFVVVICCAVFPFYLVYKVWSD